MIGIFGAAYYFRCHSRIFTAKISIRYALMACLLFSTLTPMALRVSTLSGRHFTVGAVIFTGLLIFFAHAIFDAVQNAEEKK